jgi:hypothetical protein
MMSASTPASVPPKKPRRQGLRIALVVGGLLVLCCGAGTGLFVIRPLIEAKSAHRTADAYVQAVVGGDDTRALDHVCDDADTKADHDKFTGHVRDVKVRSYRIVRANASMSNYSLRGTADVELTADDGTSETWELPMNKNEGRWKVCSG